jgi:hypothetical protein
LFRSAIPIPVLPGKHTLTSRSGPSFCTVNQAHDPLGAQTLPQAAHLFPAEPLAGLRTVGEVLRR